ncbi:MAG: hypothetical protein JSS21_12235, partial [Proteobacteria bacterium]|nr:hypothetical protein [Pseudomonadota bacterium]
MDALSTLRASIARAKSPVWLMNTPVSRSTNVWNCFCACDSASSRIVMELIQDLKEFIRLLGKHDVRYLVVGGAAVNALGFVRMTEDLDFWVQCSEENASHLLAALAEFGFEEFSKGDLLDP